MASNPNPARITDELWRFTEECLALEPGSDDVNAGTITDKPGYHGTRAWNQKYAPGNYSIRDAEDLGGPHDKTAAFDWTFRSAQAGNYDRIMLYADRLLRSGQDPDDPRGDGLREFYGQADKDTAVEGWDFRYVGPRTSDASHLWHIHFSFDRDKVTHWPMFEAVLSILKGETVAQWRSGGTQEDDMPIYARTNADQTVWVSDGLRRRPVSLGGSVLGPVRYVANEAALTDMCGPVDSQAVKVELTDEQLAEIEAAASAGAAAGVPSPEQIADAVVDEQAERLKD